MDSLKKEREGEIWAIGGGKGGTGKTFITSCMGTYLAQRENSVVLIDVDIGGANLHSFFGINRPGKSLTNFFENGSPLQGLTVKTGIDRIRFDEWCLNSDNASFVLNMIVMEMTKRIHSRVMLVRLSIPMSKPYMSVDAGHSNCVPPVR